MIEIINGDDIKLTLPEKAKIDETRITHRFYFSFDQGSYKIERILLPYVHSIFETQDSFVITTRNISLDTCIDLLEKIEDTDEIARRAVQMVKDKVVLTPHGHHIQLQVDTICIHGDTPGAACIAKTVMERLIENGCKVVPLCQMVGR